MSLTAQWLGRQRLFPLTFLQRAVEFLLNVKLNQKKMLDYAPRVLLPSGFSLIWMFVGMRVFCLVRLF